MNEEDNVNNAEDSGTMADFVQQHRKAKLPGLIRRNELIDRERLAVYGLDEKLRRERRGDY